MTKLRRLFPIVVVLALALSACEMHISTIVEPDGSGAIGITMSESTENTDFLRQVPNLEAYLETVRRDLSARGIMVENWREGDTEYVFLQNRFASLEDLSQASLTGMGENTWLLAVREPTASGTEYRLSALIDPSVLFEVRPSVGAGMQNQVRRLVGETQISFSATMPGRITYSNSPIVRHNGGTWELRSDGPTEIVVQSELNDQRATNPVLWANLVLGTLAAGSFVMLGLAAWRWLAYR